MAADEGLPTESDRLDDTMLDIYDSRNEDIIRHGGLANPPTILSIEDCDDWGDGGLAIDVEGPGAKPSGVVAGQAMNGATPEPAASAPVRRFRPAQKYHDEDKWESMKETIKDLYMDRGCTLAAMREILSKDHDFVASPKMFKSRLDRWGFHKNLNQKRFSSLIRSNTATENILRSVQATRITKYVKRTKSRVANLDFGPEQQRQCSPQLPDATQDGSAGPEGYSLDSAVIPKDLSPFQVTSSREARGEVECSDSWIGCASESGARSSLESASGIYGTRVLSTAPRFGESPVTQLSHSAVPGNPQVSLAADLSEPPAEDPPQNSPARVSPEHCNSSSGGGVLRAVPPDHRQFQLGPGQALLSPASDDLHPCERVPDRSLPIPCVHLPPHKKKFRIDIEPRKTGYISHEDIYSADCWEPRKYDDIGRRLCPVSCPCRKIGDSHAFEVFSRPGSIRVRLLDKELQKIVSSCVSQPASGWVDGLLLLKKYASLKSETFFFHRWESPHASLNLLVECFLEDGDIWKSYNIQKLRDKGHLDDALFNMFQIQELLGGIHALDAGFQEAVQRQMKESGLNPDGEEENKGGVISKLLTWFPFSRRFAPQSRRLDDDNASMTAQFDDDGNAPMTALYDDHASMAAQFDDDGNAPMTALYDDDASMTAQFDEMPIHALNFYQDIREVVKSIDRPVWPLQFGLNELGSTRIAELDGTVPIPDQLPAAGDDDETTSGCHDTLMVSPHAKPRGSLETAIWSRDSDLIRELVQAGGVEQINSPVLGSLTRQAPLHIAVTAGDVRIVELLLDLGADPNLPCTRNVFNFSDHRSRSRTTPLIKAVRGNNVHLVRLLVRRGADVDQRLVHFNTISGKVSRRMTPLALAVEHGDKEMVQVLLELGADLHKTSRTETGAVAVTPFMLAAKQEHADIYKLLLSWDTAFETGIKSADLSESDNHRRRRRRRHHHNGDPHSINQANDLISAAARGDQSAVLDLLRSGVNVNSLSFRGTALSVAAAAGQTGVLRLLLDRGADVQLAALYLERSGLKHLARKLVRLAYGDTTDFDNLNRRFRHQFDRMSKLLLMPDDALGQERSRDWFPDYCAAWAEGIRVMEGICRGRAPTQLAETLAFLAVARSVSEVLAAARGDTSLVDAFDLDLVRWQQVFSADRDDLDGYRRIARQMRGVILTDATLVDTDFDSLETMEHFFRLTSGLINDANEPLSLGEHASPDGLEASYLHWQARNAKPAEAEPIVESVTPARQSPNREASSSSLLMSPEPEPEPLSRPLVPSHISDLMYPLGAGPLDTSPLGSRPLSWPPSPRLLLPDLAPPDDGWPGPGWLTESRIIAEILIRGSIFSVVFIFLHGVSAISEGVLYVAAGSIGGGCGTPGATWNMADRLRVLVAFLASGIHTFSFAFHSSTSYALPSSSPSSFSSGNGESSASGAASSSQSRASHGSSGAMARNWYSMIESGASMWI